ncbi:MAG: TRAP transporter small permease subunit [Pseudomonadota bacterium]
MTERSAAGLDAVSEILPHAERLPHTRTSLLLRRGFDALNGAISWLWVGLVAVVMLNVLLRYLFGEGRVEFEEIQWHLYSIGFLLGLSACLDADDHVRVDVLRERFGLRGQAWIELYGLLLLFFPFVALVLWYSVPFVEYAFSSGERSDAPGGLGMRWLIKAVIPLSMVLLAVAGWGRLTRVTACLFNAPTPVTREDRDVGQ